MRARLVKIKLEAWEETTADFPGSMVQYSEKIFVHSQNCINNIVVEISVSYIYYLSFHMEVIIGNCIQRGDTFI